MPKREGNCDCAVRIVKQEADTLLLSSLQARAHAEYPLDLCCPCFLANAQILELGTHVDCP